MKAKVRRGVHDIITHDRLSRETKNPQRKFLCVASLELKRTLCEKVRDAARRWATDMDGKIAKINAEIDVERARLLDAAHGPGPWASSHVSADDPDAQPQQGFTLKY